MIVSCGEALIDFVPAPLADGESGYRPRPGGSPFNVALTIGRLGVAAGFCASLSTDVFGDRLVAELRRSGVDTAYVSRLRRPSMLAFVDLAADEPQYTFFDRDAAHSAWAPAGELGTDVTLLHFGSLSLIDEPAAGNYHALMAREHGRRILTLDPNIRPILVGDREAAYRTRLAAMLALAGLIKISRADLAWLAPGRDPSAVAAQWLAAGAALVVVTAGGDGATAYARGGRTRSFPAGRSLPVVDTVGAGDSFMGGLLAALTLCGIATPAALGSLDDATIAIMLRFATDVAERTCSRAGADPPWREEVTLPQAVPRTKG